MIALRGLRPTNKVRARRNSALITAMEQPNDRTPDNGNTEQPNDRTPNNGNTGQPNDRTQDNGTTGPLPRKSQTRERNYTNPSKADRSRCTILEICFNVEA